MKKNIVNIAAYRFVSLPESLLPEWRVAIKSRAVESNLKGSILLSPEGINLFLAGNCADIDSFIAYLDAFPQLRGLTYKRSLSEKQPFRRMLVKIKKEIIAFGRDAICPEQKTAPYLPPEQLKQWYDEGRDMVMLDARNDYEVRLGTFRNAVNLNIQRFRDFPESVQSLKEVCRNKPVVTFCTGGIRCEKAAAWMQENGFQEVYQLDGGILHYFERCGQEHYDGECFVFDQRVGVDASLSETETIQCFDCRAPLNTVDQSEAERKANDLLHCPYCGSIVNQASWQRRKHTTAVENIPR